MRGSLTYKDTFHKALYLSTGDFGPHLDFSRYDYRKDEFETIFTLLDFRMYIPGNGNLVFSGYLLEGDEELPDSPRSGSEYEFMEITFQPAGVMVDDLWVRSQTCGSNPSRCSGFVRGNKRENIKAAKKEVNRRREEKRRGGRKLCRERFQGIAKR